MGKLVADRLVDVQAGGGRTGRREDRPAGRQAGSLSERTFV